MPESPRWLAKQSRIEDATEVLKLVYSDDVLNERTIELEEESTKLRIETQMPECKRYGDLCSTYKKCLFIGCGLQAL